MMRMMFSWIPVKPCPMDGCKNRIAANQEVCAACKVKADKASDAGVHSWALQGFKDFRAYLARWAAFEDRFGPN